MKYLECRKCGYLNLIKTEYLTFCKSCGHKMENTFQILSKQQPDLSFSEYLKQYGKDKPKEVQSKKKLSKRLIKILFGFVLVFVLAAGGWYVFSLLGNKVFDSQQKSQWKEQDCGSFGLKLKAPFKLEKQYVELNQASMLKVVNIDYFFGENQNGLEVTARSVLYSPRVDVTLKDAAYQQSKELSSESGIHDFKIKEKRVKRKNSSAHVLQEGSFIFMGKKNNFKNYITIRGNTVYSVSVLFTEELYQNKVEAEKIIQSVRINKHN